MARSSASRSATFTRGRPIALASNRTARQWLAADTTRPWSQRALRQLARSPAGVALFSPWSHHVRVVPAAA